VKSGDPGKIRIKDKARRLIRTAGQARAHRAAPFREQRPFGHSQVNVADKAELRLAAEGRAEFAHGEQEAMGGLTCQGTRTTASWVKLDQLAALARFIAREIESESILVVCQSPGGI
jgi:hypothetical protein